MTEILKEKVKAIIGSYIRNYTTEYSVFKKQQAFNQRTRLHKWAEVEGSDVLVKKLCEYPETLYALFKIGLSDLEFLEFKETDFQQWMSDHYEHFSAVGKGRF